MVLRVGLLSLVIVCLTTTVGCSLFRPVESSTKMLASPSLKNKTQLDYGVYFFDKDGHAKKYFKGQDNPFYDPKKPTVIYLHGWERGTTRRNFRERFLTEEVPGFENTWTHQGWKKQNWNTAIFYWNQFADEAEVKDAEKKIWQASYLRYMTRSGKLETSKVNASIADIFYDFYKDMFHSSQKVARKTDLRLNPQIRLVGHSLGHQLVLATLTKLMVNRAPLPGRVALLDPFWSTGKKPWVGKLSFLLESKSTMRRVVPLAPIKTVSDLSGLVVENYARRGGAVEVYRSSCLGEWYCPGDFSKKVYEVAASVELDLSYISFWDLKSKHISSIAYYFSSMKKGASDSFPLSAATPDDKLRALMNKKGRWIQVTGTKTASLKDDSFKLEKGS